MLIIFLYIKYRDNISYIFRRKYLSMKAPIKTRKMKCGMILLGILFSLISVTSILPLSESDRSFIRKYSVDSSVKAILDAHAQEIIHAFETRKTAHHQAWSFPWLPGYLIKYGIDRIEGAERIRSCIKEHKLDLITVPDKRIYHIKGMPTELNKYNYAVVEKMLKQEEAFRPLNLRQVQQLCVLVKKAGYVSITPNHNFLRLMNNRLAIIDTELLHFRNSHKAYKGLIRFIYDARHQNYDLNTDFTKKALKYVFEELAKTYETKSDKEIKLACTKIYRQFKKQRTPHSWDYVSLFEKTFTHCPV